MEYLVSVFNLRRLMCKTVCRVAEKRGGIGITKLRERCILKGIATLNQTLVAEAVQLSS